MNVKRKKTMEDKMIKGLAMLGMLVIVFGGPLMIGQQASAIDTLEYSSLISAPAIENVQKDKAVLVLSDEITGRIYVRNWEDILVVELDKPYGKRIELGLDKGKYVLTNIWEGEIYESRIALRQGEILNLIPDMLVAIERTDIPQEQIQIQPQKETLLGDRIEMGIAGGIDFKSTKICDEHGVLIGGNIGVTLNRNFYIGVAGYARAVRENGAFDLEVDFDDGRPSYGGLILGYSFFPLRKVHFRVETLLGGGDAWFGSFYIFEPGVDAVFNITQILRFRFGISMPFTDREKTGLDNIMLNIGIQFGK
jgi:hypothetical protein